MTDTLLTITGYVITLLGGGGITWLITMRSLRTKAKSDAEGSMIENANAVVDIFKKLSEEQEMKIADLRTEVEDLKRQLAGIEQNACFNQSCQNRQTKP